MGLAGTPKSEQKTNTENTVFVFGLFGFDVVQWRGGMESAVADKNAVGSLNALWDAYCRAIAERVEKPLEVPTDAHGFVLGAEYGRTGPISKCGAGVGRPIYIGQYSDTATGLSYLNARYYNPMQGQFLTQDPVYLGNPSQQNLQDPQSLNAYSYSEDNPITQKDPNGLWALILGLTGTIPGWGLTGEGGIAIDQNGIDYYYGAGLAAGGGAEATAQISTEDLTHQYSISTSLFAAGGDTVGAQVSKEVTYYPYSAKKPESYQSAGFGVAVGLSAGGMAEVSGPLVVWGSSAGASTQTNQSPNELSNNESNYFSPISTNFVSNTSYYNPPTSTATPQTATPQITYNSNGSISSFVTPSGAVVSWSGQLISGPTNNK